MRKGNRRRCFIPVALLIFVALAWHWWMGRRLPARVVPHSTITFGTKIVSFWLNKRDNRQVLIVVTQDGKGWRVTAQDKTLVCEPVKPMQPSLSEDHFNCFDFDKDGYPELFAVEYDEGVGFCLWVFKRRESLGSRCVSRQPLPSWLPDKHKWVLWSQIPLGDGYAGDLTFITEPDPKQPRKVVLWVKESSSGGPCWLLSPDGKGAHPFTVAPNDLWIGVERVEDLDHDGIYELIVVGRTWQWHTKAVYKWNGRTYRLWWNTESNRLVIEAETCDLDGDGVKEIVAVLSLRDGKGGRQLAIYQLQQGRYRKVAACRLPNEFDDDAPSPDLVSVLSFRKGSVIVLSRNDELFGYLYHDRQLQRVWRFKGSVNWFTGCGDENGSDVLMSVEYTPFLSAFWWKVLPASVQQFLESWFCKPRKETLVLSYDGTCLRLRQRWVGAQLSDAKGASPAGFWVAIAKGQSPEEESAMRYAVIMNAGRGYREIWREQFHAGPKQVFAADLDGDRCEELVIVEARNSKVHVFKVEPL